MPVLVGHCLELGGTTLPYAPLVDALRPLGESVPEGASQAHVFEALLTLFERIGPVALVIEDLHWADPSTRDFLVFLDPQRARRAAVHARHLPLRRAPPPAPAAARPRRARTRPARRADRARALHPPRGRSSSSPGSSATTPIPAWPTACYARAQGNALYTEELLAASADIGELPATLRDALLGRFERLPSAAQEVVRAAAVAERPIGHALLETVLGGDVNEGAREAVAHQLLVTHPDGTYAFRHALVGEAIYEDLLPGERTALHAALARAMEADPHGAGGGARLPLERRARPAAGARGIGGRRHGGAAPARLPRGPAPSRGRARRCGSVCPTRPSAPGMPRSEVLLATAAAANDGFESGARSRSSGRRSPPPTDADPIALSGMHAQLAHYLRHANQHDASDDEVQRAVELLPADARLERARLRDQSSKSLMLRGHFHEAALEAHETAAEARRLGALDLEAGAANTEGIARGALGDIEEGARLLRRARDLSLEIDSPPELSRAAANLSELLDLAGRTEEALAEVERVAGGDPRPPRALALRHVPRAPGHLPAAAARAHGGGRRAGCPIASPATRSPRPARTTSRCAPPSPCCVASTTRRARCSTSSADRFRPTGTRSGSRCWRR